MPGTARADGIKGTVEYGYSHSETEARTAEGETIRGEAQSLTQRYRLTFDRSFYPNLVLRGGGFFERADTTAETQGSETDFTSTSLSPFADLTLSTPLYMASVGYSRREDKLESGGSKTQVARETYNATLGWKPVDLPDLTLRYIRADTFDPGRVTQDLTSETLQWSSRYVPVRPLELTYQGTLNRTTDRVGGVEAEDLTNSGRVTYADRFLGGRISVHTNYGISHRRTEIRASRGGEVTSLVQAFAGLFAIDDTPVEGELAPAPALVDGNQTGSAGIDIGAPPLGDLQGAAPRNLGLDFLQVDAEVNGLLVWVDRPLPASVASSFRWDVYVSATNENNPVWTLWAAVPSAPFGPFVNRFEVRFPSVRTRFVKVVVSPLSSVAPEALNFPDIFVTELQATLTRPAAEVAGETSLTSHLVNATEKVLLLNDPSLYYDFSLLYTWTDPSSVTRLLLSNGLSLNRRLNRWLTTSAQAARDDVDEPSGKRVNYRYGVSLSATPLRTLSHSLVYSGNTAKVEGGTEVRNSVFLGNRATLYQGVNVLLNGGASQGDQATGERTRSYLVNFGSDISPHPTLTFGLSGSADQSERTGGVRPDATISSRRGKASASWNPLPAVSLFASTEVVEQGEKKTTLHNWSLNWSPLRDGALQMSFSVSETLRPEEDGSDRLIVPSLRWAVRSGVFFDLSYAIIQSETSTAEADARVFSANLQANF